MNKSNEELQNDVMAAIKWEPLLHAAEIGVTAQDGIVTLSGIVDSYAKKLEAESAAKNVAGVNALVEKITVDYSGTSTHSDNDVAREILAAFKWNWEVPSDMVKVAVENGWVKLEGTTEWNYQKEAAQNAVKHLAGVKGVTNLIKINSSIKDHVEKTAIERAIQRSWSVGDQDIHVSVAENRVTLTGTVESIFQKDEAAHLAWQAPGVWTVDNELVVDYSYAMA